MRYEPAAVDPPQDRGAAPTAGGLLAADDAFPAELVATDGHVVSHDCPEDVVEAEVLVLNEREGLLERGFGAGMAGEGVFRENEHGILRDMWRDLVPRMRVECLDVGGERAGVVHGGLRDGHGNGG